MRLKIDYHGSSFEKVFSTRFMIAYSSYLLHDQKSNKLTFTKAISAYQLQHIKRKQ